MKQLFVIAGGLLVAGVLVYQQMQTRRLQSELVALRSTAVAEQGAGETRTTTITRPGETVVQRVPMDPAVYDRLTALEGEMATMRHTANYLMDRGEVPLKGVKLAEMLAKLNDPALESRERLNALRLLRRADGLDEAALATTMSWLNGATNSGVRQNILRTLEGMTNATMKSPMMQLALNDPNPEVREQAVDNLGRFKASDPMVEQQLWDIMNSDAPENVRSEALSALRRGGVPEHRVAALQRTALDLNADIADRSLALQALRGNDEVVPRIVESLANQAYGSQNPDERAQIFGVLDNFPDESAKVPLVYGLEDPSPEVRRRAADALSSYRDDPAIQEWLRYVALNDTDPLVRREADRALTESRRRQR